MCSVQGCANKVKARGLCQTHCKKPCSIDGCTTKVQSHGVCGKHGARGKCLVGSCNTNATNKGGFCTRHGWKDGFCTAAGCETPRRTGSRVCAKHHGKHGIHGKCLVGSCSANATNKGGSCGKHSEENVCSVEGCTNKVQARGLCATHYRKPCSIDGCSAKVQARGVCVKHGGNGTKMCSVGSCSNKVKARGLCAHHCKKPCSVDGCSTKAIAKGLCGKHGANGKCLVGSCSTNAQNKGGFCGRHGGKDGFCTCPGCETAWSRLMAAPPTQSVVSLHCHKHGGGTASNPPPPPSVLHQPQIGDLDAVWSRNFATLKERYQEQREINAAAGHGSLTDTELKKKRQKQQRAVNDAAGHGSLTDAELKKKQQKQQREFNDASGHGSLTDK